MTYKVELIDGSTQTVEATRYADAEGRWIDFYNERPSDGLEEQVLRLRSSDVVTITKA